MAPALFYESSFSDETWLTIFGGAIASLIVVSLAITFMCACCRGGKGGRGANEKSVAHTESLLGTQSDPVDEKDGGSKTPQSKTLEKTGKDKTRPNPNTNQGKKNRKSKESAKPSPIPTGGTTAVPSTLLTTPLNIGQPKQQSVAPTTERPHYLELEPVRKPRPVDHKAPHYRTLYNVGDDFKTSEKDKVVPDKVPDKVPTKRLKAAQYRTFYNIAQEFKASEKEKESEPRYVLCYQKQEAPIPTSARSLDPPIAPPKWGSGPSPKKSGEKKPKAKAKSGDKKAKRKSNEMKKKSGDKKAKSDESPKVKPKPPPPLPLPASFGKGDQQRRLAAAMAPRLVDEVAPRSHLIA